jgi:ABC-2 type transport system ATP-binding protein
MPFTSSTPQTVIIDVKNLSKSYSDVVAVGDISFVVGSGIITGLLGGNGAGKTTTMAMLLGLLEPTSGSIHIFGKDLQVERARIAEHVNFSSPYVDLPNRLTVRQNLTIYGHLYGVPNLAERIVQLSHDLEITELLNRRHGSLSAGQRTRASLAKSLLNKPQLLLLDEPTASLDPDSADWVRTLLMNYRKETGATIFLASHNMPEVERMCDDIIMMKRGNIVDRGTPDALLKSYSRTNLEDVFLDITRNRSNVA